MKPFDSRYSNYLLYYSIINNYIIISFYVGIINLIPIIITTIHFIQLYYPK